MLVCCTASVDSFIVHRSSSPLTRQLIFMAKSKKRSLILFADACNVLLVSSLYRKLVLLFLIYLILTFD